MKANHKSYFLQHLLDNGEDPDNFSMDHDADGSKIQNLPSQSSKKSPESECRNSIEDENTLENLDSEETTKSVCKEITIAEVHNEEDLNYDPEELKYEYEDELQSDDDVQMDTDAEPNILNEILDSGDLTLGGFGSAEEELPEDSSINGKFSP